MDSAPKLTAFVEVVATAASLGMILIAVGISAFGTPNNAYAPLMSAMLGAALLAAAAILPFVKVQLNISAARQKTGFVFLLLLAGGLCVYVGGRWLGLLAH